MGSQTFSLPDKTKRSELAEIALMKHNTVNVRADPLGWIKKEQISVFCF